MRTWPEKWESLRSGDGCPMCTEGRPDLAHGRNVRIHIGQVSDAYEADVRALSELMSRP